MRFEAISGWIERPPEPAPALEGTLRADVAVLGAGLTGLSAALALRAEGADVVVLEREFAGFGASGRNAGHLTPTIGKDLPSLLRHFGRERAAALLRFADHAVEHAEALLEKHAIECDYVPNGNILAAVHPKQERRLRRAAEIAAALGGRLRFLSAGELRERGLPPGFACGVLEEQGGVLDPGRFVLGLRRAALAAGVRLFERSGVEGFEQAPVLRLRTARGEVFPKRLVLATNAYTPALGFRRRAVAPLRVFLFETEPLDPAQRAALGWPGREGIYTAHEALESYRLTARGSIVGGAKLVRYAFGSRLPEGADPGAVAVLVRAFRERFPALAGLPVARAWAGWIAVASDFLPLVGVVGPARNLAYAFGYAGHGLAQATLAGALLCDLLQGREPAQLAALRRREWSWPPEPLRWLAYQALSRGYAAVDARTDRQARRLHG